MPKHSPRLFGFTLLELLVVISIIGILVAMGAASFSIAQQQGRDARRRADMKAYQNCMEQFYSQNNTYMAAGCSTGISDPVTAANYSYGTPTATDYCACANLDTTTKGNASSACVGVAYTHTAGGYFCVENLQ